MSGESLLGEHALVRFLNEKQIQEILTDSQVELRLPPEENLQMSLLHLGYRARIEGDYPPHLKFEPFVDVGEYPTLVFEKKNEGLRLRAYQDESKNIFYLREIVVTPEKGLVNFAVNTDPKGAGTPAGLQLHIERHLTWFGLPEEPKLVWG